MQRYNNIPNAHTHTRNRIHPHPHIQTQTCTQMRTHKCMQYKIRMVLIRFGILQILKMRNICGRNAKQMRNKCETNAKEMRKQKQRSKHKRISKIHKLCALLHLNHCKNNLLSSMNIHINMYMQYNTAQYTPTQCTAL